MTAEALELAVVQNISRIVEDHRPAKSEVVIEETRYVESDTRWIPASAGARGRQQEEHPRTERRGTPRLSHPPGRPRSAGTVRGARRRDRR